MDRGGPFVDAEQDDVLAGSRIDRALHPPVPEGLEVR
jgi:hypothetical protein